MFGADMIDKRHYVTHWISAQMAEIQEKKTFVVKVGTRKVQKKKGMFSAETVEVEEDVVEKQEKWVGTGRYSDTRIDLADLSARIEKACNDYWQGGFELIQTLDAIEGRYDWKHDP